MGTGRCKLGFGDGKFYLLLFLLGVARGGLLSVGPGCQESRACSCRFQYFLWVFSSQQEYFDSILLVFSNRQESAKVPEGLNKADRKNRNRHEKL